MTVGQLMEELNQYSEDLVIVNEDILKITSVKLLELIDTTVLVIS